jgi:hypothetical protein
MIYAALITGAILGSSVPAAADQLVEQRAQGLRRICSYRSGGPGNQVRTYAVGLGDACPAQIPLRDTSRNAPPTAMLEGELVRDGKRQCTYTQRGSSWNYEIPLTQVCPIAYGILQKQLADGERAN